MELTKIEPLLCEAFPSRRWSQPRIGDLEYVCTRLSLVNQTLFRSTGCVALPARILVMQYIKYCGKGLVHETSTRLWSLLLSNGLDIIRRCIEPA